MACARACCLALLLPALLAGCSDAPAEGAGAEAPALRDPVVARALNDPLMSDPDLASRNAANAVIGFADDSALPLIPATPESARAAREAGRLELLADGEIPPLPAALAGRGPAPAPGAGADALMAALGAPMRCTEALSEDFAWAGDMPPVAAIMPHGMVVQAAGARTPACNIRIVRYQTPAAGEDVLHYHFTRAARGGLQAQRHAEPAASIAAAGPEGEALVVTVRPGPTGLTAVELLYRAR